MEPAADEQLEQAPAAGAEPEPEKEEGGEEGGEQEEAVGGDGEERADERDVFGEDDSDNEEPKQRKFSRLTQQDSEGSADDDNKSDKEGSDKGEGSGKEGSDEEESPKKRKKDKESRKRDKREKKKKRKREEKEESAKKRKRRSGGGSNAGSGEEEPANEEFTEKNVFQESDDDAEDRDEGIDLETNEVVASKQKKGKFTKKEKQELRRAELQRINTFVSKLKRAALDDRNAFKERRMATKKMEMLDELKTELLRARTQQDYLEAGILNSLKLWLDPLDHEAKTFKARANSLPNKKLLAETLQLIYDLPMENIKRTTEKGNVTTFHDNMDKVEDSEIGRSVRFIQNAMETDKTQSAYQLATKVRQKWSRIIFKKSASYNKTADQMDEEEEDGGPKHLPKANREWEKMPESIKANGEKAVKGDYGFRTGASVPRPLLVDFVKQPVTKITDRQGREMELEEVLERAKEGKNEVRSRLGKVGVETIRGNTEGRNMRAKVPELNRLHVGGVAAKVTSMGWTDKVEGKGGKSPAKSPSK